MKKLQEKKSCFQEEKDSLADNDAAKLKDREIKISQEIRELQKIVADKNSRSRRKTKSGSIQKKS